MGNPLIELENELKQPSAQPRFRAQAVSHEALIERRVGP
jgi:hypothetical protein